MSSPAVSVLTVAPTMMSRLADRMSVELLERFALMIKSTSPPLSETWPCPAVTVAFRITFEAVIVPPAPPIVVTDSSTVSSPSAVIVMSPPSFINPVSPVARPVAPTKQSPAVTVPIDRSFTSWN